ncbi:DUF6207 family protein [Streptomyces sp. NPDC055961]|uniref:DUF6207 family protein n=1 Tax=Streptomyces sp. NPDC055961 TaxID=3345666 RepID=UPI0035DB4C76
MTQQPALNRLLRYCVHTDMDPIDPIHLSEPDLVVLDITGLDEETVQAAAAEVAAWWATSGAPKVRRVPGEPGVRARLYADLRRSGTS